jgi:hypothetical protein
METLVEFELEAIDSGTRLTIIKSGLAAPPADMDRRSAAKKHRRLANPNTKHSILC